MGRTEVKSLDDLIVNVAAYKAKLHKANAEKEAEEDKKRAEAREEQRIQEQKDIAEAQKILEQLQVQRRLEIVRDEVWSEGAIDPVTNDIRHITTDWRNQEVPIYNVTGLELTSGDFPLIRVREPFSASYPEYTISTTQALLGVYISPQAGRLFINREGVFNTPSTSGRSKGMNRGRALLSATKIELDSPHLEDKLDLSIWEDIQERRRLSSLPSELRSEAEGLLKGLPPQVLSQGYVDWRDVRDFNYGQKHLPRVIRAIARFGSELNYLAAHITPEG